MTARWSITRAQEWQRSVEPIRGFNYLPRSAVNTTEMWQAETFDPNTIAQELGWAAEAGYNGVRLFLQYLVWQADPNGLKHRLDRFLGLAAHHGIRAMPILFCDCTFCDRDPYPGPQDPPVPGVHNSGWTPSPGLNRVEDRAAWPDLERYVKDLIGAFGQDPRVLVWDLYNEPGNSKMGERSLPLLEAVFEWAHASEPSQPLTAGPWERFDSPMSQRMIALSDVVSFHAYDEPDGVRSKLERLAQTERPLLCTEWLFRQNGNTFETIPPLFAEYGAGWYHWGLVAGRSQTYLPWGSKPGDPAPLLWQHDVFHPDGAPYAPAEIAAIRAFASEAKEQRESSDL